MKIGYFNIYHNFIQRKYKIVNYYNIKQEYSEIISIKIGKI
mgnify:CR=1 FL=1